MSEVKEKLSCDLTEREKAILIWAVYNDIRDWTKIFILSRDDSEFRQRAKGLPSQVSRWKRSYQVQAFYEEQRTLLRAKFESWQQDGAKKMAAQMKAQEMDEEDAPNEDDGSKTRKMLKKASLLADVDFTNRKELLQWLNLQANEISDTKKRLDVVKMISELLQFKDESKQNNDVQRFYTPIKCEECVLYRHKQKEISEENNK